MTDKKKTDKKTDKKITDKKTFKKITGRKIKTKSKISFVNRVSLHFLFNALNSAAALCRKNPEAAADLVIEISTYLQKSLEEKPSLIPLSEELEHVLSYLNVQKARFPDRLRIELDMEENMECLIPAFTLQPLVDNAVRHGVLKRKQGGTVRLSIQKLSQAVRVWIGDDGIGMDAGQLAALLDHQHSSLSKVDKTLKKAGCNGLEIISVPGTGTEVAFTIPFLATSSA